MLEQGGRGGDEEKADERREERDDRREGRGDALMPPTQPITPSASSFCALFCHGQALPTLKNETLTASFPEMTTRILKNLEAVSLEILNVHRPIVFDK